MSDNSKMGFATPEEHQKTMADLGKRTVQFTFGFISDEKQLELPVFTIDDKILPKGTFEDISTVNWQCKAISRHTFIDVTYENDRTLEKKEFAINICPTELMHNKELNEQMDYIPNYLRKEDNNRANIGILGKEFRDFVVDKKPFSKGYDTVGGHIGKLDISPLVLNLVFLKLAFLPNVIDLEWSKNCMYCKKHGKHRSVI